MLVVKLGIGYFYDLFKKSGWCRRGDERFRVRLGELMIKMEIMYKCLKDVNIRQGVKLFISIFQGRVIGEN